MESILRQSRSMCPFLSKTSPAPLRSLSTTATEHQVSPGAGSMSNLQVLARRCPIMGKALAVQTARTSAVPGLRNFSGQHKTSKAKIHTSRAHEARAMDGVLNPREGALSSYIARFPAPTNKTIQEVNSLPCP